MPNLQIRFILRLLQKLEILKIVSNRAVCYGALCPVSRRIKIQT